ncbi:DUF3179 domain-containing (seleno)protein [Halalkalicoccus salilacus]|uniref:DUF3179 domain-containing (seleno)protein n=1 Tax=Halalkalicoccus sp. GCM10025704 TaxID=3252662 RepID=UPI003618CCE9
MGRDIRYRRPDDRNASPPAHDPDSLRDNTVNGGVSKDGIPSIDDPSFADAGDAELNDDDPVFGVVGNGEAGPIPSTSSSGMRSSTIRSVISRSRSRTVR